MPSFDVVSKVEIQEVKNATEQARKEILNRYDLKGGKADVEFVEKESLLILTAADRMQIEAVREIVLQRLSKRGISSKSLELKEPQSAGGDTIRQEAIIKQGLKDDELKKLVKLVKSQQIKVQSQIQADQLRVTGKKRDDLQAIIQVFRSEASDLNLQFVNFRD